MDKDLNGTATKTHGNDVTAQYNDAKVESNTQSTIVESNQRKEIKFKAQHLLAIGFSLWILYVDYSSAQPASDNIAYYIVQAYISSRKVSSSPALSLINNQNALHPL